jgi:putative heme iron utilization protein
VLNCRVQEISRENVVYPERLQALQDKFGEVVSVLRELTDFHLLALQPQTGRYVAGFGRAFTLQLSDGCLQVM